MIAPVVAALIFVLTLALIFSERLDRTIASMVGATAMVAAGIAIGFFDQEQAAQGIDFETLGLLFGMILLVALLRPTGFFEYVGAVTARASGGSAKLLLVLLGAATTGLSMLLDNVTTVVLIAPLTVLVCEVMGISAAPFLISEALLSNTGGVATLIGDPPNVLIGTAAGFSFNDFLTHALPVSLVAWLGAVALLLWLFRKELKQGSLDPEALKGLRPSEAWRDRPAAIKVLIVLGLALLLFVLQDWLHLGAAFIALSTASLALAWVRPKISAVLHEVEWSVLLFFTGLFVLVSGLKAAGVMDVISGLVLSLGRGHPVLTAVGMIWVVGVLSAIIDNVPITVALIPVIEELSQNGVNVGPLWWALAFGAGFGGNATIIGSTANIVVAQLSLKTREPITSRLWNRRGLPVMVLTCLVSSVAIAVGYRWFAR